MTKQKEMTTGKYQLHCDRLVLTEFSTSMATPTPGSAKPSPPGTPQLAPQGPSQLLTALLVRLPDATNRALIDQAAVDFSVLNSKAARKRLVKVGVHVNDKL